MFDTPFDRNAAEAAEERRDQQASELLDDGSAEETTVSEKGTALQRPRRLWLALAALFALVGAWWLLGSEPAATAPAGPSRKGARKVGFRSIGD